MSPEKPLQNNEDLVFDSLVNKFFQSGSINSKIFSLYLDETPSNSRLIIGGYDKEKIQDKDIKWMKINSDVHW